MKAGLAAGWQRGFTLVELLVVITIVAVLVGIALPVMGQVRAAAYKAACISNLRQIGVGIASYANDHERKIPYGPKAGVSTNAANFYVATGNPTSLLSLQSGAPVALGLLLDPYLAKTPKVLFCPGNDQNLDAQQELAKVGKKQAQGGYYYRHGGNTTLYDLVDMPEPPLQLAALGDNRRGIPIRALVVDTIFLAPKELESFNVLSFTNHGEKAANILYTDGHVESRANLKGRYSVNVRDTSQVRQAFDKILAVFENADEAP
jgi:prepilin-type N-terminal cleavage/methylation domain-containing protein/prepilin-type processing-associated H-X9-DG protein